MATKFLVTKVSGQTDFFSEEKLRNSLRNAGANESQVSVILKEVLSSLYQGISTRKIYKIAFSLLRESSRHLAARYHLKRAIMELGPSGYPFEKFIGEILRYEGYQIQVGKIEQGQCIKHEIDVIAQVEQQHLMIECKYHNLPGTICDVKIPLYVQSRFKDIEAQWLKLPEHKTKIHQGWLVTNTRFSKDAIQYGNCVGLHLMGWDYPLRGSLKDKIDTLGLYPITCLTSLSKIDKQRLLERKIVLCKELDHDEELLRSIGIKQKRIGTILAETEKLYTLFSLQTNDRVPV